MVESDFPTPTFQSSIFALEKFWSDYGCLIWQPHSQQVGAGTMNPATALRVLGPEPWNVAYVEPSIRPDDGRYGENPNRLQQHYQYQVILQPDPGNPQELYLDSIAALGINLSEHDIRFVEDNWEQPAIGAWGLGWEVWLDGQEITQFTYLQQVGGLTLDPVAVELTYGLERILIALQRVKGFQDIKWNNEITYGDLHLQAEQEHSRYYFEGADIERLRSLYDLYRAEAEEALDAGMLLPAYDYSLKCSHTFNVLDTRGAVGVTERARFFRHMRGLVRQVAEKYVGQRTCLGFPLLGEDEIDVAVPHPSPALPEAPESPVSYLLEIGVEELPARDLNHALVQLKEQVPSFLAKHRLTHGPIYIFGTPRRLAVLVEDLPVCQQDAKITIRGPATRDAYDIDGNPTPAAHGFARSKGVAVDELERCKMEGGEYVVAVVLEEGRPLPELLAEIIPAIIDGISFEKTMRWLSGSQSVTFSRPIRWLASVLGSDVLPFSYAGIVAGRDSRGLRHLGENKLPIPGASHYQDLMSDHRIMLLPEERRQFIAAEAQLLASEVGGEILDDPELLEEVSNLVETPAVFRGDFEPQYLELPQDVLVSVMKKHQRYFPVVKAGVLLPSFIGVCNGDAENVELVKEGNEHVIRARFADASYFVRQDLEQPLESFRPRLSLLTFQQRLGSMLDKSERLLALSGKLSSILGLEVTEAETALRAAYLAKADLATQMVVEMTSLQGVMGREYALRTGEIPDVAQAIEEHYWPKGAGYPLPRTRAGTLVGLADRIDSLVGLFAAGLAPSGSSDPFGLRRAALGVVQVLLGQAISFDLRIGIQIASDLQPIKVEDAVLVEVADFISQRLRGMLGESGYRHDVVEAVLDAHGHDPYRTQEAAAQLAVWTAREDWDHILDSYARCVRIIPDQQKTFDVIEEKFVKEAERDLWSAIQSVPHLYSVDEFFIAFTPIIPAITRFFDDVMVMDDDTDLRTIRLGMMQCVGDLANGILDLSKLEGF